MLTRCRRHVTLHIADPRCMVAVVSEIEAGSDRHGRRRAVPHRRADRSGRDGRGLPRPRPADRRPSSPSRSSRHTARQRRRRRSRGSPARPRSRPGCATATSPRCSRPALTDEARAVPRGRAAARQVAAQRDQAGGPRRAAPRRELRVAGAAGPRTPCTRAGILHRDLKPANIMLEPSPGPIERVVLIDFGFATFEGSAKLTLQGTVVGSLHVHRARAAARRDRPTRAADLYAIGVILFELLTGAPPFNADDDFDLIELISTTSPRHSIPLPRAFDEVIWRAREAAGGPVSRCADDGRGARRSCDPPRLSSCSSRRIDQLPSAMPAGLRLLVVDDHEDTAELLAGMLELLWPRGKTAATRGRCLAADE